MDMDAYLYTTMLTKLFSCILHWLRTNFKFEKWWTKWGSTPGQKIYVSSFFSIVSYDVTDAYFICHSVQFVQQYTL